MSFASVAGQEPAVATLETALRSGRVHHAYRFEGPDGVGKTLAAVELARVLLCEAPAPLACGACSACRRVSAGRSEEQRLSVHPDLLLVQRGIYKGVLAAGEASGISIEQVRRIVLSRVGFPPHEGRALVCLVQHADELTPSAANALLKTLEEPPQRTFFVLITSRPSKLLDTIRSRTLPVRFGPLPERVIADLLAVRGLDSSLALLAEGSMRRALELADPELLAERRAFADAVLGGLSAPDLVGALAFSERLKLERQELAGLLEHLAQTLAAAARTAAKSAADQALRCARQHEIVEQTRQNLELNMNPQLALEALLVKLRRV
jgi:DNA polymerase-3 subunit delta'